ncbi:MAG: hypothetical protein KBD25_01155 [Rickettsiaceae bacterium]|nr:hypothetical protein [Rickettsiaceae bacterium]
MKDNGQIVNPYLDSRNDWNEIYAKEKANAIMWRRFGLLNMLITSVAVIGMIYVAQLPAIVPFLFKEDAAGGITALGIPTRGSIPKPQIFLKFIAKYCSC